MKSSNVMVEVKSSNAMEQWHFLFLLLLISNFQVAFSTEFVLVLVLVLVYTSDLVLIFVPWYIEFNLD